MSISALTELEVKVVQDLAQRPPSNLVNDALRRVWREFLLESEVWREELTAFDAVEDQATYTLTPSAGVIKRITWLKYNGSSEAMDPDGYYLDGTNTLTFEEDYIPSEDITDGIEVEVALEPDVDGTAGSAWILNRWAEGLVAGAQMRLTMMRNRGWYDPDMHLAKKSEFYTALGDAVVYRKQKRTTRKTGFSA